MSRFLSLELKRLRFHVGVILSTLILVIMLGIIGMQVLDVKLMELVWVLLPLMTLAINGCYQVIFEPSWVRFVIISHQLSIIRLNFLLLSLTVNLPIGVSLGYVAMNEWVLGFVLWLVLDIMGFLLHCIRAFSYRSSGTVIAYIFLMPLVYPWVLFGIMASSYHLAALKLIIGSWLLVQTIGVFLYQLCFKVGEVGE